MVWKPLKLSPAAGNHLPTLLISETFKADAYTINLSDLTYIWSESLDHKAILRRSRDENTSIDLSDGEQLRIFLDKIKLGLQGGKDTTLALTINAEDGRPPITLNITVNLPGGLAPLQWPIYLAVAPQNLVTSQLTVPLLRAQHARMQEMASLVEGLKEKDHVIQRLVDKLEEYGTDLGQVFPQAAATKGRKADRKRAEERVKGLGPFDLAAWKNGLSSEGTQDTTQLIGEVFAGEGSGASNIEGSSDTSEEEEWWEDMKGITINLDSGKFTTKNPSKCIKRKSPPKPALPKEASIEDNDDFQVQATPPHLVSPNAKLAPPKALSNDSTDDDDGLDAPSQRSKIPDSFPTSPPARDPSPKAAKKLAGLGGEKAGPKPSPPVDEDEATDSEASSTPKASPEKRTKSSTPAATLPKRGKLGKIGGKKEVPPEPAKESTPRPRAEPAKPKKGNLGQIGGKKKEASPIPAPEIERTTESLSQEAGVIPKRKLGTIGRVRSVTPTVEAGGKADDGQHARGRPVVKEEKEKSPEPRETSEERANKKREQLKRDLEEKAKAPVKKKRKF